MNAETAPEGGLNTLRFHPSPLTFGREDAVVRVVNALVAAELSRGRYRTHAERLRALQLAGAVCDERYFDALAKAVPWS